MKQFEISVIIPVYQGKKYILYLLKTLYQNFCNFVSESSLKCEVIFVNDYPAEILEIEDDWKHKINIQIVNLLVNGGIHNARITGLSVSRGKYVLFLDQDDHITDDYIISQWKCLRDGDAVLCNGYMVRYCMNGKNIIYPNTSHQKSATFLEELVNKGNLIVSPGQVLIKKSSIPALWTKVVMRKNGADDYLLWILILSEGKKIIINEDKLYTHIGQGNNSSQNVTGMWESLKEMINLLENNNVLPSFQLNVMKNRIDTSLKTSKLLGIIGLYDQWMHLKIRNKNIAEYLLMQDIKRIAIYGLNYIGNRLYDDLKNSEIEVIVGIDQNADGIYYELPVLKLNDIKLENYIEQVDLIVVTPVSSYQEIKQKIESYFHKQVVSINEIFLGMAAQ